MKDVSIHVNHSVTFIVACVFFAEDRSTFWTSIVIEFEQQQSFRVNQNESEGSRIEINAPAFLVTDVDRCHRRIPQLLRPRVVKLT